MRQFSLKTRLAAGAVSLGAATLLTALILWLGMEAVAVRLDKALATEARMDSYASLSTQAAGFLVVATEAVHRGQPPATRQDRVESAAQPLRRTFSMLRTDVESAVEDARDLGLDEQSRFGTQSLGIARMEALLDNTLRALAADTSDTAALQASIDIFASGFDPLLSQAVNTELLFRSGVLSSIETLRERLRLTALSIATLTLFAVALFYLGLIRPQFSRLDRLREAARKIGGEDFGVALPEGETDEIGQIYAETNRMASALAVRRVAVEAEWERLNETIAERTDALRSANATLAEIDADRRRFFADVSHELRTPLTVILMEAEIGARRGGEAGAAFGTIQSRAARLTRRIEDLLRVARSESGQLQLDAGPVSLPALIADVRAEIIAEIDNAGMVLAIEEPAGVDLVVDGNWIRQVLVSLVRNSIRHARDGRAVRLRFATGPDAMRIEVIDNGPGISPGDRARVFERFAQGEANAAQGFGLGLALASWVVEAHGGTIEVESPVTQGEALGAAAGTKIALRLPRANR